MEKINKRLKLIDRISDALKLPHIRKYISYNNNPDLFKYFSELGYTKLYEREDSTNYLFISYELFSDTIQDIFVSSGAVDHGRYYNVEVILRDIPIEELERMTDEELELLIKLN